jgi:hypothetical protein
LIDVDVLEGDPPDDASVRTGDREAFPEPLDERNAPVRRHGGVLGADERPAPAVEANA